jgi:hypothetical protein
MQVQGIALKRSFLSKLADVPWTSRPKLLDRDFLSPTTTTSPLADMSIWKDTRTAQLYKASEHVTGPPARRLIEQVGLLQVDKGPLVVLDSACGTSIASSQLYEMLDESARERLQLTCGDYSERMVQSVQQ